MCLCRGRPTDIYALGVCLFTFVYGRIPFSAPTVYQLFQVVQTEPLRFPDEPQVSEDLKDLLSRMLHKVRFLDPCISLPQWLPLVDASGLQCMLHDWSAHPLQLVKGDAEVPAREAS